MRWLLAKATGLFEGAATQVFDAVVAATPHIAEMFPARKTFVVFNYPQFEEFTNPGSLPLADRAPDFTYIGGIARVRGIEEMVAAFAETADPRIHFRLAGPFLEPGLEAALVASPGWSRVRYHGWLSRKQIADLCDEVLAGLVVLQPIKRYMHSLPIKLFEYMSAGLPVIASDFPLWRKIIERHRCGILVNPTNPRDIAKAMDWVVTHRQEAAEMGARGRQAVLTEFNWGYATGQLLACYKQVLA
jgi:glycosyltransferase involved in cell wall biosynthesis